MSPSATPAAENKCWCEQVPRLPLKTKVDMYVSKGLACHAKCCGAVALWATNADQARPETQPSAISATPAPQNQGRCRQVPRLPRKRRLMWASATPATQSAAAPRLTVTKRATRPSPVPLVPRLPRKEPRSMSPSATPATQSTAAPRATTKRATRSSPEPQVPRLPRKTKVDVAKRHNCHRK